MPTELLEAPYSNVQNKDLVSDAEAFLSLGITVAGSTSLTLLQELQGTLGDLIQSELLGIWKGRADIADTLKYARDLRAAAERRHDRNRHSP